MRVFLVLVLAGLGVMTLAGPSRADFMTTFTGSGTNPASGQPLAASATFTATGSTLTVTLTNTSTADVLVPSDVLTGVYFTIAGNPTLTRVSAVLTAGSSVFFPPSGTGTDPGGVVGGEWAYKDAISVHGATQGISSSGLGIFGAGDLFPGTNLQGPVDPDGIQYGITSAGDDPATGNAAVTGSNALIHNSVTFTLSGLPGGLTVASLSSVVFQYGTALTEPSFPGDNGGGGGGLLTPEPASVTLLAFGGFGLLAGALRRRKAA